MIMIRGHFPFISYISSAVIPVKLLGPVKLLAQIWATHVRQIRPETGVKIQSALMWAVPPLSGAQSASHTLISKYTLLLLSQNIPSNPLLFTYLLQCGQIYPLQMIKWHTTCSFSGTYLCIKSNDSQLVVVNILYGMFVTFTDQCSGTCISLMEN